MMKLDILAQLHEQLGEIKIDIVVFSDPTKPFARLAMQEGVKLWPQ